MEFAEGAAWSTDRAGAMAPSAYANAIAASASCRMVAEEEDDIRAKGGSPRRTTECRRAHV